MKYEELSNLMDYVLNGDLDRILSFFKGTIDIDLPVYGRIYHHNVFKQYLEKAGKFLKDKEVRCTFLDKTITKERVVYEYVLEYDVPFGKEGERVRDIPVGIVGDVTEDGLLERARVYYSTLHIFGHCTMRRALFEADPNATHPEINERYYSAIRRRDIEGTIDCFNPDGYFRGETKARCFGQGREGLRKVLSEVVLSVGNVYLQYGTVIDDTTHHDIEFFYEQYGENYVTPQAGLAVYGTDPKTGLLAYARIYDDVCLDNRLWP